MGETTHPALTPRPAHVPADRVVDFDMYAPPGIERDYHAAWKRLQDEAPDLVWTPRQGGHWILTRGRLIHEVFADYENFTSEVILVPKSIGEQHGLLPTTIDPPEHRRYRALLNDSLSPRAVRGLEDSVRTLAVELIERVAPAGRSNFTHDYAEILPIRIFMRLVDLPLADAPRLKYLADQTIRPDGSISFADALQALLDYLAPVVEARMARPGDDMVSRMVAPRPEGAIGAREALELTTQILIAGLDTVVNFLGFAFLHLASAPALRRQLVERPDRIAAAVDELLRRFPVVTVARMVRRDMVFEGMALKAGEMVLLPTALHGLDGRDNPDPLTVDLDRPALHQSTFGNGVHRCPGAQLARTEIRVTIEEWLARIPDFAVEPGAEITHASGIVGCVKALPLVWPAGARQA